MSLKAFHIAFIALATALCAGFAIWCFRRAPSADAALYRVFGGAAILAAALLPIYGVQFLKKMKGVGFF